MDLLIHSLCDGGTQLPYTRLELTGLVHVYVKSSIAGIQETYIPRFRAEED